MLHIRTGPSIWHIRAEARSRAACSLSAQCARSQGAQASCVHRAPVRRRRQCPQRVQPRAASTEPVARTSAAPLPYDTNRLLGLLQRMADTGKPPEEEWLDMLYGATAATLDSLTAQQRASLVTRLSDLGVTPPLDWLEDIVQVDMSQLDGSEVVDVWIACELSGWDPGRDWVQAAMQRILSEASHLSAAQAAIAITLSGDWYSRHNDTHTADTSTPENTSTNTARTAAVSPPSVGSQGHTGTGGFILDLDLSTWLDTLLMRIASRIAARTALTSLQSSLSTDNSDPLLTSLLNPIAASDSGTAAAAAMRDALGESGSGDEQGEGEGELPPEAVVEVSRQLTHVFRHTAPTPWLQVVSSTALQPSLSPYDSTQLALSLAAAQYLPDLVYQPQLYIQVLSAIEVLPGEVLCDVVWCVATWHVCREGGKGGRYDFRPPTDWWDEWFQATGRALRDQSLPREVLVRVLWSLAVLRVRPPLVWTQLLVRELSAHVLACDFTPLELVYVSRSGDLWYGMLLGVDENTYTNTTFNNTGSTNTGASSHTAPLLRVAGVGEAYPPPPELPGLVRDCIQLINSVTMPAGWRRINPRYPPYVLPERTAPDPPLTHTTQQQDTTQPQQSGTDPSSLEALMAGGVAGGDWRSRDSATRIYGPLTPPAWR